MDANQEPAKNPAAQALGKLGGAKKSAQKKAACKANAARRYTYILSNGCGHTEEYTSTGRGALTYADSKFLQVIGRKEVQK